MSKTIIIDLHGIKHQDVNGIIDKAIFDNPNSMIKLIIGNSKLMEIEVKSILKLYDKDYSILIPTEIVFWT